MENSITKDFVEWHKRLGINKIYIYDNSETDEERFEEVLQEYIDDNFVEIEDKRGDHNLERHHEGLNEHYMKYNNKYDWLLYLD